MTTQAITRTETKENVAQEAGQYAVKAVGALSALIGVWGIACLIGGLASSGAVGLFQGYISALTGM